MITTVFSTTDSPYMNWQSELLEYSWKRVGQPGELVRLVATDTPESLPEYRDMRCVATRQWKFHPYNGDDFPPLNKPGSLLEWLLRERPQGSLLLLDPDCVFRAPVEQEVLPGHPVGQHWVDFASSDVEPFGLGPRFDGLRKYCIDVRPRIDPVMIPNLIHADDMLRIALRWLELTAAVRQEVRDHHGNPMWESDMFGFIAASAEHGLRHELGTLGICTNWSPEIVKNAPIIHYCQPVRSADDEVLWSKGSYEPWSRVARADEAAEDYGRDLLHLINAYVDSRSGVGRGPAARPRRRPGVTEQRGREEVELLPPDGDEAFVLNFSAEAVWGLCDGARSVAAIRDELASRFGMEADAIAGDVETALRAFEEAGLLELGAE